MGGSQQKSFTELVADSIMREFEHHPYLQLTGLRAQKLWGLDRVSAETILEELRKEHKVLRTPKGEYVLDPVQRKRQVKANHEAARRERMVPGSGHRIRRRA